MAAVLLRQAFGQLRAHAQQAHNAARRNQSGGVQAARRDLALRVQRGRHAGGHGQAGCRVDHVGVGGGEFGGVLQHGAVHHPAHHSAYKDGERSGDGEIRADGKRQ